MRCDVLVVGASVAGCTCAKHCASAGLSVAIAEEHAVAGKQGRCTAIVSKRGLDSLGVDYEGAVLNEIYGARMIAGSHEMRVQGRSAKALVLDRQRFDGICAREAKDAGAMMMLATRVNGFSGGSALSGKKRFDASFIVGADGSASVTASAFSFPAISEFVVGYQEEYRSAHIGEHGIVDVLLDARLFPGFFAWFVPCGRASVRIGFAANNAARIADAISSLRKRYHDCIAHARKTREFYAPIPLRVRSATQRGSVLLAGDAAGQTKATTGGGIVFGGNCARIAAEQIIRTSEGGRLDYERAWRGEYGDALSVHYLLRKAYNALGREAIEALLCAGNAFGLSQLLARFGDMDFIFSGRSAFR
jgi:geranylgeranyl reductase family protein